MAFDRRIESGVELSDSTAPPADCAFIVITALAAAIPNSGSFSSIRARQLFCGNAEEAVSASECFWNEIEARRSGQ
jgi:hypothetical protein